MGKNLWKAFKPGDLESLKALSKTKSNCFEYLEEVCQAHIDRFPPGNTPGRPDKVMREILKSQPMNFQEAFHEFSLREGIYGFSDLQVRGIYERSL